MNQPCKRQFSIFLIVFILFNPGISSAVQFVKNGKSEAVIIVPDKPFQVVKEAAKELQYFISRSTGVEIPVFLESKAPEKTLRIFLGNSKASQRLGIDTGDLSPNHFIIRLIKNDLFLLGDDSAGAPFGVLHDNRTRVGTLFAVYEFLENALEIRWLWPGKLGEVVPHRENISVEKWNKIGGPAFIHSRWRDGGTIVYGKSGWSSPKIQNRFVEEQSKWLRRHRFSMGVNLDIRHAFTDWWHKYSKPHKDFFNLLPDGVRHSDPVNYNGSPKLISMCVSNPALHKRIVDDSLNNWKEGEQLIIDASENDTPGKCTCSVCLGWDAIGQNGEASGKHRLRLAKRGFMSGDVNWYQHLGSLSDRYSKFLLSIQKEAEKRTPNPIVMGFAYANHVKAPNSTILNDRIIIGVVPPMTYLWNDETRKSNRKLWNGWRGTNAQLLLRPNWMLTGHNMPVYFARKLGEDFLYFAKHGMIGTDFDSLTGQYGTQGPNLYMLARLHSQPDMSVDDVLDEYFSAFGKAKKAIKQYFKHWERINNVLTKEPNDIHWSHFYRQANEIYTEKTMRDGGGILKAAFRVDDDSIVRQRIRFLQNGLRNAELTLATQEAYKKYQNTGKTTSLRSSIQNLDRFRATIDSEYVANMSFLFWAENRTWRGDLP